MNRGGEVLSPGTVAAAAHRPEQGAALAGACCRDAFSGAPRPAAAGARPAMRIDDVPRGILFMIAATVLFAVSSAIAKWQVALYPVGEVMAFRSLSSLYVCAAVLLPITGLSVFATQRV